MATHLKKTLCMILGIAFILISKVVYEQLSIKNPNVLFFSVIISAAACWLFFMILRFKQVYLIRDTIKKVKKGKPLQIKFVPRGEIGEMVGELINLSNTLKEREEEIRYQQQKLLRLAYLDPLTGLPNRQHFFSLIENKEYKGDLICLSIILARTDRVNALNGPGVIDTIILEAAERLSSILPSDAIMGRVNSNQFDIILPAPTNLNLDMLVGRIQSIQKMLEWPYFVDASKYYINTYVGLTQRRAGATTPLVELVQLADLSIVERKEEIAPSIFLYYSALKDEQKRRHNIELALREAITNKKFAVAYQPIVGLRKETVSLEALVRWKYDTDWISPSEFIPIIEELGLMEELTLQIADQVARDWKILQEMLPMLAYISINVSPSLFKKDPDSNILQLLLEIFLSNHLPPDRVCLEITENVLLEKNTLNFMEKCNRLGFKMAVDDFGTGYSSMSYLANYNFEILKIDRAFVMKLDNEKQREVAKAIINLAKRLDLEVIAEGVETERQLWALKEMGADSIQGYLFGRPQFINEWDSRTFMQKTEILLSKA
ncbi:MULTISPECIES: bifunctional diguanylate cyclase/phosphodiesterase [Bacillus]|nr:bifunctional diguanylate cyclase/phosphodiesterase [Bacillus sp. MMSF_3328]